MPLPLLTDAGELPPGVHTAPLSEVRDRFSIGSAQRTAVALRLERIYRIARSSGHLARFVVFGSFVTDKEEPADLGRDAIPLRPSRCSGLVWRERILGTALGCLGERGRDDRVLASEAGW